MVMNGFNQEFEFNYNRYHEKPTRHTNFSIVYKRKVMPNQDCQLHLASAFISNQIIADERPSRRQSADLSL